MHNFGPFWDVFDSFHAFVIALVYGESKQTVEEYLNNFLEEFEKLSLMVFSSNHKN